MNLPMDPKFTDRFFKDIVETLPYEIFVCDAEGIILYLNTASQFLTSRLKENIISQLSSCLFFSH